MMSGIYAGDGSNLSIEATFPILPKWEREHGSVIRGALRLAAKRRQSASTKKGKVHSSIFLTPRRGLSSLVSRLEEVLQDHGAVIHLNQAVTSVNKAGDTFELKFAEGESAGFDGVILATPSFISAQLLENLSAELTKLLSQIEYASTATVNLAFHDPEAAAKLTGYGYVIPRTEGRAALACTWTSTKFPHRAPDGTALVRVFLGRAGQQQVLAGSDDELVEAARAELRQSVGIDQEPDHIVTKRWPRAMPQYNVGHHHRVGAIMAEADRFPALQLAGGAYHGIGIPDCINSGRLAASQLLDELQPAQRQTEPA